MLKKIVSINNIGRFRNHNASGDVEIKRYTMIFAENGRGKTTLCAILRSLQSGDPAHISGRTMLGATDPPEARLLLEGGTTQFANGSWSTTLPDLAIFDSTFVSENVYSGDVVDIEHRRRLYRVIVGEQRVALARRIEELDSASRAKATEIRQLGADIQQIHIPPGVTLEDFLGLEEDPEIDAKIEAAERERDAVRQADQVARRAVLSQLGLPEVPGNLEALLGKTLENVSEEAEQRVAAQIAAHNMHTRGESWLAEGLGYIAEDACPFCSQSLEGVSTLVAAYSTYFSDAYNGLRQQISQMRDLFESQLGDRQIAFFESTLTQNAADVEFWNQYCDFASPGLDEGTDPGAILRDLRSAAIGLLDEKLAAPLELIPASESYLTRFSDFTRLQQSVSAYNEAATSANTAIQAKKEQTDQANLTDAQAVLARLRATKKRHDPQARTASENYLTAQGQKTAIEEEKAAVRTQLDEYTAEVIERYEQTINQLLEDFNAGFRITQTTHAYPGGVASSSYSILINNTAVALGDAETPLHVPSFKNTLSAGDRSTLALAFFLAQLEHDPCRAERIVVFDDPFNSQDSFRRDWTIQKIKRCGERSSQVIVLSHDSRFLKRLWDRLAALAGERSCLEMTRVGRRDTTICVWDIEEATQAEYNANRLALREYHLHANGNPRDVIQKIRPVLESYCRYVSGGSILPDDTLGVIIGKVRDAESAHVLFPVLDNLDDLNEYTRRYHHGENPNAATEPIDQTELDGFAKRTLDITGGC